MYKVDKRSKENNNIVLNGTYNLFDELKAYDIIRDKRPTNVSALSGITTILEGSRWQVGNVTSTHLGTANWYYISRLEAFWEYLEKWNVEFKPYMTFSQGQITGRYIDIVDKRSDDYGKWYEYGDKLLDIKAEQASDSLYTAFVGRGKGEEVGAGYGRRIGFNSVIWATGSGKPVNKPLNQDFVEIPSATAHYGYSDGKPRMAVVVFDDVEDPVQLLEQTYEYALNECRPKLQLRADVLETQLSELGEICTIIRDDIGIRYKTRVFKLTRNFLNKNQKTVEFGDEIVQSTAQRNNGVVKTIKKQDNKIIDWLNNLRNQVIDTYFNEDGYNYDLAADNEYDLPAGYYSFDRPVDASPTKVIYMGAGKLLIANAKLPNGQWDWTTAIDGDGANLDAVNTGILQAGRIQSAVDGSFWDLDNGYMNLKSGIITGTRLEMNLGTGSVVSSAQNGAQTLMQNGVLYVKSYNGQALGTIGAALDGNENLFSIDITQDQSFTVRYQTGANTYRDIIGYYDYLNTFVINNATLINGWLRMNGALDMQNHDIQSANTVASNIYKTGSIGTMINDGNRVALKGVSGVSLGTGGQESGGFERILWLDATYIYANRNLSMENHDITNQSDERLKDDIEDSTYDAFELFKQLRPRQFVWKDKERFGNQTETGFIAQEVKEIDPLLITQTPDETLDGGVAWSVNETQMNRKAWIALHQTAQKVSELEEENNTLKQELEEIKKHLGLS